jgi:hypothetical protein
MPDYEAKFLETFKQEHQTILDGLLDLRGAIRQRDAARAQELVRALDQVMGPHFRVEEEALYPMLTDYLGTENVRNLLDEHRGAIAAMHLFKQHMGDPAWLQAQGPEALKMLEGFFMHVTSCDGLSIIIERFSDTQKIELAEHLDRVQAEPLPLTEWRPATGV